MKGGNNIKRVLCMMLTIMMLTSSCVTKEEETIETPNVSIPPSSTPSETPTIDTSEEPAGIEVESPSPPCSEAPPSDLPQSPSPTPSPIPSPIVTPSEEPSPLITPTSTPEPTPSFVPSEEPKIDYNLIDEQIALTKEPAVPIDYNPVASGVLTNENQKAIIDYSNYKDGYVMVKWTAETTKKLKVQVIGPTTTYTYSLTPYDWVAFALSDGNGEYKIKVFENVEGTKYAQVLSTPFTVEFEDEFIPFLKSNQYVNFGNAARTQAKALELCQDTNNNLQKVDKIYLWVVNNITYDYELAETVKSGYTPNLDAIIASKKGICFDYAALMAGMLRSQNVPCKLVVGYAGPVYHAWINVYTEENGWIDGVIYFNGRTWQHMDPTFAANGNQSEEIMQYIGNGANYTAKYFY